MVNSDIDNQKKFQMAVSALKKSKKRDVARATRIAESEKVYLRR